MSKINETNYPRRTQANYADTDMLVIQAAGGNTYTTRLEDMREDYEETLAPTLSALQDDVNENLATIEGSTASKVYAKGDYLIFGGKLCRVTSTSIAAGATLTIGTNIELAPVGDELKTLSSDLASKQDTIVGNLKIYQSGNVVTLSGYLAKANYSTSAVTIGTIPAGFKKPIDAIRMPCMLADAAYQSGVVAELYISNSNGQIDITAGSSLSQKVAYFCVTYVAA